MQEWIDFSGFCPNGGIGYLILYVGVGNPGGEIQSFPRLTIHQAVVPFCDNKQPIDNPMANAISQNMSGLG
jgi:hypothetical protein